MITRQSGTEWSKSCHMFHEPSLLPAYHSFVTQAGSIRAFTSRALPPRTMLIGRSLRSQTEMAGNQSSGETSIDISIACTAKHFAFVMRHDSPDALAAATTSDSRFFSACVPRPVALSVTSWRNFLRR